MDVFTYPSLSSRGQNIKVESRMHLKRLLLNLLSPLPFFLCFLLLFFLVDSDRILGRVGDIRKWNCLLVTRQVRRQK